MNESKMVPKMPTNDMLVSGSVATNTGASMCAAVWRAMFDAALARLGEGS